MSVVLRSTSMGQPRCSSGIGIAVGEGSRRHPAALHCAYRFAAGAQLENDHVFFRVKTDLAQGCSEVKVSR